MSFMKLVSLVHVSPHFSSLGDLYFQGNFGVSHSRLQMLPVIAWISIFLLLCVSIL
jgi:hypothetical protein